MPDELTSAALRRVLFGRPVYKDPIALPASGVTQSLFTVSGGRVLMLGWFGECTTVCSAAAETLRLLHTPTTGTLSNLSAVSASIANKAVGTLISVTGLESDALALGTGEGGVSAMLRPVILRPGTLGILGGTASNTGAFKYVMGYVPLDEGATVDAA